jgi:hypothetical protein
LSKELHLLCRREPLLDSYFQCGEEIVEKETSLSCLIDAGGNIGICALHLAVDLLVNKARTSGFAIVGIHNSSPPGTGPARLLRRKNRAGRFHWPGLLRFKQDGCAQREQRTRLREQSGRKGLKRADPARDIHLPGELSFIRSEQVIATQESETDDDLFRTYRERILSPFL